MDRSLDYYFQCYLHQSWDCESGSNDIRDSLAFFFKNECGDDPQVSRKLASQMITQIDEVMVASDERVLAQVALANLYLPTAVEARALLRQMSDWSLSFRARAR